MKLGSKVMTSLCVCVYVCFAVFILYIIFTPPTGKKQIKELKLT